MRVSTITRTRTMLRCLWHLDRQSLNAPWSSGLVSESLDGDTYCGGGAKAGAKAGAGPSRIQYWTSKFHFSTA